VRTMANLSLAATRRFASHERKCFSVSGAQLMFQLLAAILIWLPAPWAALAAEECESNPLPCIVRVLAQEKSNAEDMARLLHTYAGSDAGKESEGIKLYSIARSSFEGVIERRHTRSAICNAKRKPARCLRTRLRNRGDCNADEFTWPLDHICTRLGE